MIVMLLSYGGDVGIREPSPRYFFIETHSQT